MCVCVCVLYSFSAPALFINKGDGAGLVAKCQSRIICTNIYNSIIDENSRGNRHKVNIHKARRSRYKMLSAAAYLARTRMQIQLLFLSARNDESNARSAFVYPPVEISCAFVRIDTYFIMQRAHCSALSIFRAALVSRSLMWACLHLIQLKGRSCMFLNLTRPLRGERS